MKTRFLFGSLILILAIGLNACGSAPEDTPTGEPAATYPPIQLDPTATGLGEVAMVTGETVSYSLTTGLQDGKMVFIGVGGEIDGLTNPMLMANVGDVLEITLSSGEGAEHDISFPDFNATSARVSGTGSTTLTFTASQGGEFAYFCTVPGHRQAGMEGIFQVAGQGYVADTIPATTQDASSVPGDAPVSAADIVRAPTDLPGPIGARGPTNVSIFLEAVEVVGELGDGVTYTYWTFNGRVPGPFFRIRVGDTVEVHMKNSTDSTMTHSVDFHAVTGPGGGAVMTQTPPGGETVFTFQALNPGLYVYHCATPMVAQHISNGMYGLILVEPEGGLPLVDREFYVMQGEIYTVEDFGTLGLLTGSVDKLLDEEPEFFVFNGTTTALTSIAPLTANTGETVRIFFGVGGPNFTSSFHVIGEVFDRVYNQASLTSDPLTDVQTTLVPPGGAAMVEFHLEVPGRYILVDHALSRLQRGLAGFLLVEGPDAPDIFQGTTSGDSGH
ncbi:MAG: nitrite reductase, copper-containing [Chloroflexi bacterium]|nr:nitrite reductase, copper-containing [Chloroflexota bacterium]